MHVPIRPKDTAQLTISANLARIQREYPSRREHRSPQRSGRGRQGRWQSSSLALLFGRKRHPWYSSKMRVRQFSRKIKSERVQKKTSVHRPYMSRLARRSKPGLLARLALAIQFERRFSARCFTCSRAHFSTNHANHKSKTNNNGRRFRQPVPRPRHGEPPRLRTCRLPDPDQGRAPLGGRRGDPQLRRMRVSQPRQSLLCRSNQNKCTGYTLHWEVAAREPAKNVARARTAPK